MGALVVGTPSPDPVGPGGILEGRATSGIRVGRADPATRRATMEPQAGLARNDAGRKTPPARTSQKIAPPRPFRPLGRRVCWRCRVRPTWTAWAAPGTSAQDTGPVRRTPDRTAVGAFGTGASSSWLVPERN